MPGDETSTDRAGTWPASPSLVRYLRQLIGLPMLPLLAVCLVLAAVDVVRLHAADDRAASLLASNLAGRVAEQLRSRVVALQLLAESPLLDAADLTAFHRRAQSFRALYGSELILSDREGQMLVHSGQPLGTPLPALPKPPGRAAAPEALATGRPAVGDLFVGPVQRQRMVAVAAPVVRGGSAGRSLLTPIPVQSFDAVLAAADVPVGWQVALLDGAGQAIGGHPGAAAAESPRGGARFSAPVEGTRWSVVVALSPMVRLGPLAGAAFGLLAAIAGATLLGGFAGRHGGRRLARAVASLAGSDRGAGLPRIAEVEQARDALQAADAARTAAGEALQRSEARLRAVVEGLADALVMADAGRRITMVNPAFSRIFGYPADEVLGRTTEFLYADPADFGESGRSRFVADGTIDSGGYEMRYRRRDGSVFWAETVAMRIGTASGEDLGMLGLHRDITQRRQAHEALRRSRAQLQAFIEQSPHSIAMLDRGMNYIAVSGLWQQKYGAGHAQLAGLHHYEVLPGLPDAWKAVHRAALDGHTRRVDDDRWVRADGSQQWLRWVAQPWTDEAGAVGGVIISTEDVSEQHRALERLRDAHRRFATVFEIAPVAMVVGDLGDGRFVEVNAAFEALTGHRRGDVVGQSSADFALWPDEGFRTDVHRALRERGAVDATEATLRRHDGTTAAVSFSACTVEIGGRRQFVAMMVDVTVQREAREALQRQQAELASLVAQRTAELEAANATLAERAAAIADLYDNAPCGYHSLAPDGTLVSINATELAMLGYRREDVIGQPFARLLTPASQALFRERYAAFLRTGVAHDLAYEVLCKDGRELPVLVSAVVVRDAHGRHMGNRATMTDDSERRARARQIAAMQAELARRADEAEAATRAKSAFLANMSHEIRTPMNAIIGLTQLMAREVRDPQQSRRLATVDAAARHLLQVINDVLDLSKIEAGKMVLERVAFSLDALLERAVEMVAERAREKGLELVLDTGDAPEALVGDPTRLAQAVINLLSNAVKFTEAGWVRLALRVRRRDGDRLLLAFEVRDTGVGIPADEQAHLFDAFEQADSSISRRHGGTGLGLALTRHIATTMSGEVGVDSRPGQGSRFWFSAWLEAGPAAAPRPELAGRRVLLVDDLGEARQALREQLLQFGLDVDDFGDPQAALAHFAAAGIAYDLLLLDARMGPPDGPALLAALRDTAGGGPLPPAVLASAVDDDALRAHAAAAGFARVLAKPVTPSTLHDTLVELLLEPATRRTPPAAAAARTPGAMERVLRERHGGRHVLLAEDNPINQEVALQLLRAAGLEVETVADGAQAVEHALARPFDLVLMDMQMPGMDGLEATRRIRAAGRRALPIVAMTANAFAEDRLACLDAGMDDHLAKPVDAEQLYATLEKWLSSAAGSPRPAPASPLPLPSPPAPAAAAEGGWLAARLAGVAGLDVPRALRLMGGDPERLRRALQAFVDFYGALPPTLDGAQAHSLRGACAGIGAVALEAVLLSFERAAAGGTDDAALQARAGPLLDAMRAFVEALRRALGA